MSGAEVRGQPGGIRLGLAGRLVLVSGAVMLLFVAAQATLALREFRLRHEQVIGQQLELLAATVAEDIDATIRDERLHLEETVEAMPPGLLADPRATAAFLERQVVVRAVFDQGLAAVDAAGRVVAVSGPPTGAAPAVLAGGRFSEPPSSGRFAVSAPFEAAGAGGRPAVAIGLPIRGPGGEVAGRLVGAVELLAPDAIGRFAGVRIGHGGYFSLVTPDRVILMHADRTRLLQPTGPAGVNLAIDEGLVGRDGWRRTRTRAGLEMVTAVRHVASTGWLLAANLPAADADAPFEQGRAWYLVATAVGALLLLAAVWLTTRRLMRPLADMTSQVEAMAGGAEGRPVESGGGEVGPLAAAFNRLVAQRRRAEEALRASEERFRTAFKMGPEPFALSRLDDGVLVEVNEGFTRLHGYAEEAVVGRRASDLGIWVDPAERDAIVEEVRRTGRLQPRDVRLRRRGGEVLVAAFSGARIDLGGVPYLLSASRDVTEERRAAAETARLEAELRASEARHLAVVRNLPVVQWVIGEDGRFTMSMGGALPALGLAEGQVVGQRIEDVYAAAPDVLRDYRRARGGETFVAANDFGAVVFESHWAPVRDERGRVVGVSGQAIDVTERVRAEAARREGADRLAALERLAAMGRVAAGVAHEINNPLTYVIGALDSAAERLRQGEAGDLASLVAEARGGAERVRRIVGDLRLFARSREEAGGSCDAAAVARVAVTMVQNEIRHRARLELELAEVPPAAMAEHRLVQVLVNLLVNACHAIPEGRAGENRIGVAVRAEGGEVVVEVRDTGVGMSGEVRARIFEPFFTTRGVGEGIGLGLALCQAMVTEVGGRIEVESAPGAGSTFRVRLRAAAESAAAAASPPPPEPAPVAPATPEAPEPPRAVGPLRILVVDDEPMVARAVGRLLGGHQVDLATSGAQALERIRAGASYQVVICDLMMPDLTGMDLRERLAVEAPALARRMVFLTGGAFTERARAFVEQGDVRVLEKPVDADALRALVAEIGRD